MPSDGPIRAATDADRDAIAALHLASWRDAYVDALPERYREGALAEDLAARWAGRTFAPPMVTLVAEGAAGLDGFVCCFADRDPPYIDNLHVRPGLRSKGTGAALMSALFAELRGQGRTACALTVLEDNPSARRFYARLGGVEGAARGTELMGHPVREVPVTFDLDRTETP